MADAQEALQAKREEVNEGILEVDRVRQAIDAVGELDDGDRVGADVDIPETTMEDETAKMPPDSASDEDAAGDDEDEPKTSKKKKSKKDKKS